MDGRGWARASGGGMMLMRRMAVIKYKISPSVNPHSCHRTTSQSLINPDHHPRKRTIIRNAVISPKLHKTSNASMDGPMNLCASHRHPPHTTHTHTHTLSLVRTKLARSPTHRSHYPEACLSLPSSRPHCRAGCEKKEGLVNWMEEAKKRQLIECVRIFLFS